jgi:uncharacterized protein with PQ loop repeat
MSEIWALAGATFLSLATLPQLVRLVRTRRAHDFATTFALLNLLGVLFLAARSAEIGETAFLAVNLLSALFWAVLLAFKALTALTPNPVVNG